MISFSKNPKTINDIIQSLLNDREGYLITYHPFDNNNDNNMKSSYIYMPFNSINFLLAISICGISAYTYMKFRKS